MNMTNPIQPWFLAGCLRCSYTAHTPYPSERCPNDKSILLRMEGLNAGHAIIEVARALARYANAERAETLAAIPVAAALRDVERAMDRATGMQGGNLQ